MAFEMRGVMGRLMMAWGVMSADNLMHPSPGEATTGQMFLDLWDAEGDAEILPHGRPSGAAAPLKPLNGGAQSVEVGTGGDAWCDAGASGCAARLPHVLLPLILALWGRAGYDPA